MAKFYAHSFFDHPQSAWQPLEEHLLNVAEKACTFASKFNAAEWAYLAGLWHDLGKFSPEFQQYLRSVSTTKDPEKSKQVRIDHSTAGARHAVTVLNKKMGWMLAYAIAGHHSGLPKGISNEPSCLKTRLELKKIPNIGGNIPQDLIESRRLPAPPLSNRLPGFQLSFFIRMLYSCLTDADFLDTERFMSPERLSWREGYPPIEELKPRLQSYMKLLTAAASHSSLNVLRNEIRMHCLRAARKEPGFFSLTVPTGGGKTLSSLSFALDHALHNGLDRIIYVIPYTSIIEQNAAVFREAIGNDAVLEHHANFEPGEEDQRSRLAAENWDAPLIVTTNVQFFESLFAHRSSRARKLHNICKSVIILDEAQMLPVALLKPSLETIRLLVAQYGCTAVLCTATQPALSASAAFPYGLENVREIMPDPEALYKKLRRIRIDFVGKLTDEELVNRLQGHKQVLCIVNTRNHAAQLFKMLEAETDCYHLSANMCPAHRSRVLLQIREALQKNLPCQLISTQLVEAGVDLDFPVVFRCLSGLDSIAQAGGRCNREGRLKEGGSVYVFATDSPPPPGFLRQTAQLTERLLPGWPDILALDAVKSYFRELYWLQELDEKKILDLLDGTPEWKRTNFDFPEIARRFKIIEDTGRPFIIRFNKEANRLINDLSYSNMPAAILRKLQRYIITIPEHTFFDLEKEDGISWIDTVYPVLERNDLYDEKKGFHLERAQAYDPEYLMI